MCENLEEHGVGGACADNVAGGATDVGDEVAGVVANSDDGLASSVDAVGADGTGGSAAVDGVMVR